jgi:hypothetical protein
LVFIFLFLTGAFLMKKIISTALGVLAAASFLSHTAQAGNITNSFEVKVNLTSACIINSTTNNLDFGTYTAFVSASVPAPTVAVSFRCTQGFIPTNVVLDTVPALSTADSAGLTTAGAGVIAGLRYTLSVAGVVSTAGAVATTSVGSAYDTKSYTITGGMIDAQAGLYNAVSQATQTRTLTLSF